MIGGKRRLEYTLFVASHWRRVLTRLSSMSWDEAETRLRQGASKRLDVGLSRFNLQPGCVVREPTSPPGNFFFSGDEIRQRVSLLKKNLPDECEKIIEEANEIRRHRFRLLGYADLDYGAEIDWHLDAVHGLRAPLIPWFKINFLDFSQVGDHKIIWELNRHQSLVTLAKAWQLTGDDDFAREVLAHWYSWQRANPYPLGANWASSLELAFRSISWIWVHRLLANCAIATSTFREDLVKALALHGWHIRRYLSTYFSPNTHLIGEAVALFLIGTLYPQISSAEQWRNEGWRISCEEALRQVRPDGGYFEQSLYYHVYALDFFCHARVLASRNGIEIPADFDAVLKKMLAFLESLSQIGLPNGFGDDDGGRLFAPRRNRAEHLTDPLAMGAAMFHDARLRAGVPLTEEAIWLFGERALSPAGQDESLRVSEAFPDSGLYILRSSKPFAQQMVIDAGPQGTGRSGHGHADALSVKLAFGGRFWLADSGSGCYVGPGDDRNRFRGTRAHNTLAVDGQDQAEADGPFAWNFIPEVRTDSWITGNCFDFFAGSHDGYERLPQTVRHCRFVFHSHEGFWLVRDVAEGHGSHLLETSWHFAPDHNVINHGDYFAISASLKQSDESGEHCLTLFPSRDEHWKADLLYEKVSPAYGLTIPAPVIRCQAQTELPQEHAVLLQVAAGEEATPGSFVREQNGANADPNCGLPVRTSWSCAQNDLWLRKEDDLEFWALEK